MWWRRSESSWILYQKGAWLDPWEIAVKLVSSLIRGLAWTRLPVRRGRNRSCKTGRVRLFDRAWFPVPTGLAVMAGAAFQTWNGVPDLSPGTLSECRLSSLSLVPTGLSPSFAFRPVYGRCRGGWEDKKFWDLNREIRIPKSANKIRKIAVILFSDFCQFFHFQERCISA